MGVNDSRAMEKPGLVWYNSNEPDARGLAAPGKHLLSKPRSSMSRTVQCVKLCREADGLGFNDYRVKAMGPKARDLITGETETLFVGTGSDKPEG